MGSRFFKVLHRSKKSKARLGEIRTGHGVVMTPAFVSVATKGTIKALPPSLIKDVGQQVSFVNTYHLVTHPGGEVIEKAGGIHAFARLSIPLMSDSGGFQVFSLARKKVQNSGSKLQVVKVLQADIRGEEEPLLVKISEDGVRFRSTFDGSLIEFTPEKSIEYQMKIGADMMMAFDECTYYPSSYEYAEKSMRRTHTWLVRCVDWMKKLKIEGRYLYGIIQGGMYEDLRKESAEFVVSQDTDGVALGGVSVGESKKEMRDQARWVSDYFPADRPVHLLGVGQFDDVIDLVKHGIDTFDCVEPTRLARVGRIYQRSKIRNLTDIDIFKARYKHDLSKVDEQCECYVCVNFTKAYLHHLFKQKEILGYTLVTYHNLSVMNQFFSTIRELIADDKI